MTQTDIEIRLREALIDLTQTTPLENPERPRADGNPVGVGRGGGIGSTGPSRGAGRPAAAGGRSRPTPMEVKVLTAVGCVVLLAAALGFGAFHLHRSPSRIPSAHTRTTVPTTDVTVPDVVGQMLPPALSVLERAGLQGQFLSVESSQPNGTVVHQTPAPGTEVSPSATIVLNVAGGGRSSEGTVTVPNVVGESLPEAEAAVRASGLDPMTPAPTGGTTSPGTVTGQAPGAGRTVVPGSTVILQATAS
jgi:beta-lactam-binding protein with PASTA domain